MNPQGAINAQLFSRQVPSPIGLRFLSSYNDMYSFPYLLIRILSFMVDRNGIEPFLQACKARVPPTTPTAHIVYRCSLTRFKYSRPTKPSSISVSAVKLLP